VYHLVGRNLVLRFLGIFVNVSTSGRNVDTEIRQIGANVPDVGSRSLVAVGLALSFGARSTVRHQHAHAAVGVIQDVHAQPGEFDLQSE
jgi:hypothetical protein